MSRASATGPWGEVPIWRGPWPRRSSAFAASLCLHVLALLLLASEQLPRMDLVQPRDLLPVTIVEPAKPKPAPPSVEKAPAPEPISPPSEPAKPEPEPEKEPPAQAIPLPEQQIVSPPDAGEEIPPPPDTRLLSDRDNTVAEQMVRRGEPARQEGAEATEPEPPPPAPKGNEIADGGGNQQLAALPKLDQLLPNALQLAGEGYGAVPANQEAAQEAAVKERPRRHFDNVWLPTSKEIGTLDFLPDVREGDITLLNTKAELFAPFVRRVAVRVFQNLLILLRRELPGLAGTAEETVTMEAIMTRGGDLASLTIKERSSDLSIGSGRMLQQACRQGFFDRNPPAGAESDDGQIHFLLRTHILAMGDGGGVRYGYRVAFQAGLR